jgi:hypothetical protein
MDVVVARPSRCVEHVVLMWDDLNLPLEFWEG